jgi:bacillithiol biosynthesis cysteine-adding enzyme BshC
MTNSILETKSTTTLPSVEVKLIPFEDFPQLSVKDKAYYDLHPNLAPFYKYPTTIEAFADVIKDKAKDKTNRAVLVEVLKEQYANLDTDNLVGQNVEKLASEKTFTVITAHQPSLFTGPLYYIYKIISVINLAEKLNAQYPDNQFVPIFVTGGEDHDFEEVNYAKVFNKKVTWENEESGSVGMMKTETLKSALEELKEILGESDNANEIYNLIEKAHTENDKYSNATIQMVHELFKDYGLVVVGMNHPKLKAEFRDIIKAEVIEQVSKPYMEEAKKELEAAGFSSQAHARDINFFYLRDQMRNRIVFEDDKYKVLDSDFSFTKAEMEAEIDNHPERFSPNVVMRPLYQERIFPNLAYIGGGGELAYWLERKKQFEHFGLNFPMLIRRNSALWVDKGNQKRLTKLDVDLHFLLQDIHDMEKAFVRDNTESELSLKTEKGELAKIFEGIVKRTQDIDKSLVKTVKAEMANQMKSLSQLEGRLMKAEKQRHEISLNQLKSVQERLFPNNGLQERTDNFLQFYLKHGKAYFAVLKEHLHPLEKGFVVIYE